MSEIFDLLFIDVETSGLSSRDHEILEIAMERINPKTFESKASYHKYVLPTLPVPAEAAKINGYSPDLWRERGAIDREIMIDQVRDLHILDGATPAGQNPGFDMGFLRVAWHDRNSTDFPRMDYHLIDVAVLAWPFQLEGLIPGVSLRHTSAYFGYGEQKHTAIEDLKQTIDVYRAIMYIYRNSIRSLVIE